MFVYSISNCTSTMHAKDRLISGHFISDKFDLLIVYHSSRTGSVMHPWPHYVGVMGERSICLVHATKKGDADCPGTDNLHWTVHSYY